MASSTDGGAVEWLPWSGDAFRRARAEGKAILLSVVASWARGCDEMDRVCYSDPSIADRIGSSLIAIRIDADDRPDVADRYDLGGLPTTAFLSDNGALLGGGTFVPPERLRAAIDRLIETRHRRQPDGGHRSLEAPQDLDDTALTRVAFDSFDDAHGGFGGAPKFPLTAPIHLAIDLHADGDATMLDRAVRTLDAMGWGPLYDAEGGGFFRCARAEDWTSPEPEKLLATNVALLDLYLHAAERLGHGRWFSRAADIVEYLNTRLGSSNGWRVAECAEPSRRFTDGNAHAVSAMLRAAVVMQDDAPGQRALNVLERALLASYKPGQGVAHAARGVRGLLVDQAAMATASLDAWEATGNVVYRMMAEELMHYALRTMWDDEEGGFFDRATDPPFDEPPLGSLKPLGANCDAAIALVRIAEATGEKAFAERARETVAAMATRAAESGPLAAHYLIARRAVPR